MFNAPPRKLPYPLDKTAFVTAPSALQPIGSYPPTWGSSNSSQQITISLTVSLDEFIAIQSSIDVGRDIAYGADSVVVWESWIKGLTMNICDAVADCIANSTAVQEALNLRDGEQRIARNSSENSIGSGDGNLLENLSCDLDTIYGVAVAVEDYIYRVARDTWESVLDTVSDAVARARLVDYLPFIGDLPGIDDINDVIDQIRLAGIATFNIGYNTQIRQENICGLFAIACTNCELLASDVSEFYASQAAISWAIGDQLQAFLRIVLGEAIGEEAVVAAWMSLAAAALASGGELLGRVGLFGFRQIAASGEPDSDWEIFCDPCAPPRWTYTFDFSAESGSFATYDAIGGGQWIFGEGWQTTCVPFTPNEDREVIRVVRITNSVGAFDKCEIEYVAAGGPDAILNVRYEDSAGTELYRSDFEPMAKTGSPEIRLDAFPIVGSVAAIRILSATDVNGCSGVATILRITFEGEGINPFL